MTVRLSIVTVGCKCNSADSASMVREASGAGFEIVPPNAEADLVLINGCAITRRADRDSRAVARRSRRRSPGALLVMTGCHAATATNEDKARVAEVDRWIPPGGIDFRTMLPGIPRGRAHAGTVSDHRANRLLGHSRTFLKIQDGCDDRCAYCIVPFARGRHRSLTAEDVIRRAVESERDGAAEILLTGVHIGRYGSDRNETDALAALLVRLLRATTRVRFRLGSIEPSELSSSILSILRDEGRTCTHLHLPLQSGSPHVLSRMGRGYPPESFASLVRTAKDRIPGIRVGVDVLAGFPGETGDDFEQTVLLLDRASVDYVHAFPYSPRPGTLSAGWNDDVPGQVKRERIARLVRVDRESRSRFLEGEVGRHRTVFAMRHDPGTGNVLGVTESGIAASFPGDAGCLGSLVAVRVESHAEGRISAVPEPSLA